MSRESQTAWKRRKDASIRQETGWDQWPCSQCGEVISYSPRGGNRMMVCRQCAPNPRFRSMVRRYGVDKSMFEAMYFDQDGKCAIASCSREACAIDHDHATGRVRGLLCRGCNVALGFMEDQTWVSDAKEYIR